MTTNERIGALELQVAEIHEAVYGNGKPGIKADVHAIKMMLYFLGGMVTLAGTVVSLVIAYNGNSNKDHDDQRLIYLRQYGYIPIDRKEKGAL